MKKLLLSISFVLLFSSVSLFALAPIMQRGAFIVSGIGYESLFAELKLTEQEKPYIFGLEVGVPKGYFTIAPKIGLEWFPLRYEIFCPKDKLYFNISVAEFFSKSSAPDLRLIPQIGYSFRDRSYKSISVSYAYALPVLKENTTIARHRFSLELSIPTWLFGQRRFGCGEDD